ncbi:MAG: hypothetical protein ACE148_04545 [Vicinamibacterales bacterium]
MTFGKDAAYHVRVDPASALEPEARHRLCWYGRRTPHLPQSLGIHTIEDGMLLYCAHPMLLPVVGHDFDIRNCDRCDYFRRRSLSEAGRSEVLP